MTDNDLTLDRIIDLVLNYLSNHKREAVEGLFGEATDDYQAEWLDRDVLKFWSHLDLGNRRKVIKLAVEYYGYAPVAPSTKLAVWATI